MNYWTIMDVSFLYVVFSVTITSISVLSADLKGFDDTVLFKINWPGKDGAELLDIADSEAMMVMTSNKEKYKCIIPTPLEKSKDSEDAYEGPNALDILQPLFSQSSCTYRLESYWTYEVCHGRYVRQYHEDREVSKTKTQEYFLGRWDKIAHDKLSKELDSGLHYPPPIKKLDGLSLPYLQLNLTDGTTCDLNGKPRRTNILYVCYSMGKHEIYSLKETSTCEYELIVLSSLLCQHPKYKPQDTGEHAINCLPLEESPKKPRNLRKIEAESVKLRHQRLLAMGYLLVFATFATQPLMKALVSRIDGFWRLLVVDIYLIFSFCGTVNVWRGVWNMLNLYFLPETPVKSYWVSHVVSFVLLIFINSSNSILVRGVYIDGEEQGAQCVDFPCYYLRLFFQTKRKKKLLAQLQMRQVAALARKSETDNYSAQDVDVGQVNHLHKPRASIVLPNDPQHVV